MTTNFICSFQILGNIIYIDSRNSNFSFEQSDIIANECINLRAAKINADEYCPPTLSICINVSDACNLACDYCFNKTKTGRSISANEAISFINNIIGRYPNKEKYYVDLSGKGEPLLALPKVLKINDFCKRKSNELKKEILVSFVCNGSLLSAEIASILQNQGILFGVSLDGDEAIHDEHRKTISGEKTYRRILNNVESIKNKEYIGCAVTITKDVFPLLETELELLKTFNTISVKPVRLCDASFDATSLDKWKKEYDKLVSYLERSAVNRRDIRLLKALLNGNDYLGKYILRIFLGQRTRYRCDAGISRFTLDLDGNIYICPAASGKNEFLVGKNGYLDDCAVNQAFKEHSDNSQCDSCPFLFFCGGECLLEKSLNGGSNNSYMCEYKRHLILLAMHFALVISTDEEIFSEILAFCQEVDSRDHADRGLLSFTEDNPYLSFNEAKVAYDNIIKRY